MSLTRGNTRIWITLAAWGAGLAFLALGWTRGGIDSTKDQVFASYVAQNAKIEELKGLITELIITEKNFIMEPSLTGRSLYSGRIGDLGDKIGAELDLLRRDSETEARQKLEVVKSRMEDWKNLASEIRSNVSNGNAEEAFILSREKVGSLSLEMDQLLSAIQAGHYEKVRQHTEELSAKYSNALAVMLWTGTSLFFVLGLLPWLLGPGLFVAGVGAGQEPKKDALRAAPVPAPAALPVKVKPVAPLSAARVRPEISREATLARKLEPMIPKLAKIAEIADVANPKGRESAEPGLSARISRLGEGVREVMERVGKIAEKMDEQLKSAEAPPPAPVPSQTQAQAQSGAPSGAPAAEAVPETTLKVFLREIETKTRVIDDIVFQTKILSFNAAVEAAHAGEYGRGFAVVAAEIGKLAELSGKAAKEIDGLLSGNQKKILEDLSSRGQEKPSPRAQGAVREAATGALEGLRDLKILADQVLESARRYDEGLVTIRELRDELRSLETFAGNGGRKAA